MERIDLGQDYLYTEAGDWDKHDLNGILGVCVQGELKKKVGQDPLPIIRETLIMGP